MTGHGRWSAALAGVMVAAMGVGGVPAGAADTPGESSGGAAAAAAVVPYTTVDLGALAVDWFPNFSVNERGQVAGKDMSSAFLWDPVTGKRELSVDPWRWDGVADLNERGQVAGTAFTRSGDAVIFRSVLWDPVTGMRDLGTLPGGNWSATTALNEQGQVAGTATTKSGAQHAFLWDPDTGMRDLGAGTGIWSEAVAVNERGQVAGTVDPDSANRSFLWDPVHGMQDLGTHPGGEWSVTTDLNERGQVVGSATTKSNDWHAFLWGPATGMRDLGTLGGRESHAAAVNERGQVAGGAATESGRGHAFLWDPGTGMRDLGSLPGHIVAYATHVNERGQVAGFSYPESGLTHAFLWDPVTGMRDLGTLGGRESRVYDMNERGQVVGLTTTASGTKRAVLWTPSSLAPRVSVTVARAGYGNQLFVDVNPTRGSEYWTFRVQKRTPRGSWTTLPGTYRTQGTAETRTITLGAGVYRVTVAPRYGYRGATSAAVRLTRPTVKVVVRAVDSASRLFVDVDPDKGAGSWSFRVQKRTGSGSWTTLATTYTTLGVTETRTINLRAGTYRVKVNAKYGFLGATSAAVRILR